MEDWTTSDSDGGGGDGINDFSSASDSDENYKPQEEEEEEEIAWRSDGDEDGEAVGDAGGEAGPSRPTAIADFVAMGFSEEAVERALLNEGEGNTEAILNILLNYPVTKKSLSEPDERPIQSSSSSFSCDDYLSEAGNSGAEEFSEDLSGKDWKLMTLADMGFPVDAASSAINRCGHNASILELADSIHAASLAEEFDDNSVAYMPSSFDESCVSDSHIRKKMRRSEEMMNCNRSFPHRKDEHRVCLIPKPMVGFGLPNERPIITHRKITEAGAGPPYFYYENVALTPKGVWETMSRFLYDIDPEFVDSQYFCAAARKRGYIHNLPIRNRFPLLPLPPRTVHEALPYSKKWWPSWDPRTSLNCLQTSIAAATTVERIRSELVAYGDRPPTQVQNSIVKVCRKWNLVWIGPQTVAPLEPDEFEMILGFPKDHTRGIGKTDRYKSLGNSFQVDTVAFHLSVLKDMFPNGIKVLSLFSGIGGAEVALHRLGIHLTVVVSAEISEVNQNLLRGWWENTNQTGILVELGDVKNVSRKKLEEMIDRFNGFDLVIGGSPCNNLSGNNRVSREGLEGEHSALFYDYYRILEHVKSIMERKR